jgi:methylated-DNA-[protein]-cysteine S-methyltransferase
MAQQQFALFETAIGACGIAWGLDGVIGLRIPDSAPDETRARMRRRFPDAVEAEPPEHVRLVTEAIAALFSGEARDLSDVPLDMSRVTSFNRRVYEAARLIPPGDTRTYGEIASEIGEPGSAREIGQALAKNPFPIVVPCHRVLAAGGKIGGFSAPGGIETKRRMLAIESAHAKDEMTLFFQR